jgi:sporulation-control protein spo0M
VGRLAELIKIDIDRPPHTNRWWLRKRLRRIEWVLYRAEELLQVRIEVIERKRSRKGLHVIAEVMGKMHPAEIVAIQAAAGSDPIRELLNLHRIRAGFPAWNVMFNEKDEYQGARKLKGRSSREKSI